jgi:acetyltransferase-like isoleucine patch superfamily enzyme
MFDVNDKKKGDDLDIIIQDDVWIASGVIILKGVTIGKGSIIGAGSLVNTNISPYSIAVGTPARVIKKRFNKIELEQHIKMTNKT